MNGTAGLYIHIPFCKSKCAYCDFFSKAKKESLIPSYINALCNEIKTSSKNENLKIDTVFIGGGTPSIIPQKSLEKLCETINSICTPKEFTIEANPDDITEDFLKLCIQSKITRLSVGIQSLCEKSLFTCGRRADSKTCINALSLIKKIWKNENRTFSVDLISALPHETEESFLTGLKTVTDFSPDHISLYDLMLEEGTSLFKTYKNYDEDAAGKMWLLGRDFLTTRGYEQYEVSNFCKKGNECLHNLKYWSQENYIGVGSGATGTVYKKNPDFTGFRKTNTLDIEKYISYWEKTYPEKECSGKSCPKKNCPDKSLQKKNCSPQPCPENKYKVPPCPQNDVLYTSENLDKKTCMLEFFMMGLRLKKGICETDFIERYDENFPKEIKKIFCEWKEKNLAEFSEQNKKSVFSLNEKGLLFLNVLLQQIAEKL